MDMEDIGSIPHFFESLDLVNGAILGTNDLGQMMSDVLDVVLDVFGCDRAYLLYPSDPQTEFWSIPMERTRPEYPGVHDSDISVPMDSDTARNFQTLLDSKEPLTYGAGNDSPLEDELSARYSVKSFMATAIFPKSDKPWQFGIQQCTRERVWAQADKLLFKQIGRRIADGLSLLLTFRELKESEASYSRFVNTANEGVWGLDGEGKATFVNARMAEMLGYTTQEILGRPVTDFMFEEDLPDYRQKLAAGFQEASSPYERRYRRKNGETIWVLVAATGLSDEEGKFVGAFSMVTDITEKKRAEEDLRRLNEELEARVASRTSELQASHVELEKAYQELKQAHASLLQQEKMASIGQLAAGIAHEINTPTQYVSNNIGFLRESLDELFAGMQASLQALKEQRGNMADETRSDLDDLLEEIDYEYLREEIPRALEESAEGLRRIANIVMAMKEFAHPSGDNLEPVDLRQLIRNTAEITRNSWKVLAELVMEMPDKPLIVNGLRDELGQVLLNLIVNAVDAITEAPRPGNALGRIRIQTKEIGNKAEIQVEDSGCGIPPELMHKIFEPFFTTKQVGQGSGQGLAIAYHIITDKHGGELQVDSVPGEGSTFTIRLPLLKAG